MKILWIEDFGAAVQRFELAEGIFNKFIPNFSWDYDEDISDQLFELSKNQSTHEVSIIKNYPEFRELKFGVLDFDIIIIDFNLSEGEFDHSIKPEKYLDDEKFHERAGFYIFSYLITNSFPLENIVFMTGEIDSTLQDFLAETKRMYLPYVPNHFGKNKDGFEGISKYLSNKANDDYLILRRGIIEACVELKNKLETVAKQKIKKTKDLKDLQKITNPVDDFILFNKTCPESSENLSKDYIIDYLTKLETFFPLNLPENKEQLFYLFLKELSAEWEMSEGKFVEYFQCPEKTEYYFKNTCQRQMKLLRNWTVHYQLTKDLNERDVAFFFMLAMRAWFDLDYMEIFDYENILADIFDQAEIINIKNNLAISYHQLSIELKEEKIIYRGHFFQDMIEGIGESCKPASKKSFSKIKIEKYSMKWFYQNFLHGLFPANLIAKNPGKHDSVQIDVYFGKKDQVLPENSYPYFLGKLIYKESF